MNGRGTTTTVRASRRHVHVQFIHADRQQSVARLSTAQSIPRCCGSRIPAYGLVRRARSASPRIRGMCKSFGQNLADRNVSVFTSTAQFVVAETPNRPRVTRRPIWLQVLSTTSEPSRVALGCRELKAGNCPPFFAARTATWASRRTASCRLSEAPAHTARGIAMVALCRAPHVSSIEAEVLRIRGLMQAQAVRRGPERRPAVARRKCPKTATCCTSSR